MTNWEILSTAIEIIGTIAVVVTLVYVAIQVKLNSRQIEKTIQATKTETWHAVNENFMRYRDMVISSDNAGIWIKGINNLDELESTELIKFNMMAGTFLWSVWEYFMVYKNEGLIPDVNSNIFTDLYRHEGYRNWLINREKWLDDEFGTFLESAKEAAGTERYKYGEMSSLTDGIY